MHFCQVSLRSAGQRSFRLHFETSSMVDRRWVDLFTGLLKKVSSLSCSHCSHIADRVVHRMTMDNMRKQLWITPSLLFCHYDIADDLLSNTLKLTDAEALEKEYEPLSPEVEGMATEERHEVMRLVCEHALAVCEGAMSHKAALWDALKMLGWTHEMASWSDMWWKNEKVYMPPYASPGECRVLP